MIGILDVNPLIGVTTLDDIRSQAEAQATALGCPTTITTALQNPAAFEDRQKLDYRRQRDPHADLIILLTFTPTYRAVSVGSVGWWLSASELERTAVILRTATSLVHEGHYQYASTKILADSGT